MSQCQCPLAGYCRTHKRHMSELRHHQCQSDDSYYESFQQAKNRPKPSRPVSVEEEDYGPWSEEETDRCLRRLDLIDPERKCDTCGNRGTTAKVYGCLIHGECSYHDKFRTVKSCRWCWEFLPSSRPTSVFDDDDEMTQEIGTVSP